MSYESETFPPFSLTKLLDTVFKPVKGQKVAILFDFEDPTLLTNLAFLKQPGYEMQKLGYEHFHQAFKEQTAKELGLEGGDLFAYQVTGGSNLDLPEECIDTAGNSLSLAEAVYKQFDIILCISTFSATAPLTEHARYYGFKGATLHGLNPIILSSGLAVNYEEISVTAEKIRQGLTKAEAVEIDFSYNGESTTLRLDINGQEAQKSHGLCRGRMPDVANLPAGEVYFVPESASGKFPMKFEDGTIAMLTVETGRVTSTELKTGPGDELEKFRTKCKADPAAGDIGELGFGTQYLPVSGHDIQDEKIFGTFHVATGRSDHLGGDITPVKFKDKGNATHDDILFAPHKTPEINAPEVRLVKNGKTTPLIQNYKPTEFYENLRNKSGS